MLCTGQQHFDARTIGHIGRDRHLTTLGTDECAYRREPQALPAAPHGGGASHPRLEDQPPLCRRDPTPQSRTAIRACSPSDEAETTTRGDPVPEYFTAFSTRFANTR